MINIYRKQEKNGLGVDVFPFEGVDMIVDTSKLPFRDGEFHTVTMLACLNYISNDKRLLVLKEAHRVLDTGGQLLITMINPFIGYLCHKLVWWNKDQNERGIKEGENLGLSNKYVINIATSAGLKLVFTKSFFIG